MLYGAQLTQERTPPRLPGLASRVENDLGGQEKKTFDSVLGHTDYGWTYTVLNPELAVIPNLTSTYVGSSFCVSCWWSTLPRGDAVDPRSIAIG